LLTLLARCSVQTNDFGLCSDAIGPRRYLIETTRLSRLKKSMREGSAPHALQIPIWMDEKWHNGSIGLHLPSGALRSDSGAASDYIRWWHFAPGARYERSVDTAPSSSSKYSDTPCSEASPASVPTISCCRISIFLSMLSKVSAFWEVSRTKSWVFFKSST